MLWMDDIQMNHFDEHPSAVKVASQQIQGSMETNMTAAAPTSAAVRRFSTEAAPSAERAWLFQQEMQRLFSVGLAVRTSPPRPLSAQMVAYRGRSLRMAALKFSAHSTVSLPTSGSAEPRLLVSLHKDGVAIVSQGGRESRIEPGDVFVIDPSRPFSIETGEVRSHSVYLPTSAVRALVPQLDDVTALAIRSGSGAAAMYRAAVDELFATAASLKDDDADRIGEALPYLLAAALSPSCASDAMPSRLRLLHKRRILQFVRDHLSDPQLDANAIARGVNLSARHVYELFSDEAEPLMKRVWSERLERCSRDLREPSLRSRTIGEIAYHWDSATCRTSAGRSSSASR
jgi:AraC family transcriptional regulator, positive regulator of tynA and feaB